GGDGGSDGGSGSGGSGEAIYANGTEPGNPLIPQNTREVGGGRLNPSVLSGLGGLPAQGEDGNAVGGSVGGEGSQAWTDEIREVGGGRIITSVFSGLVYYTAEGKVENEVAESIETEDSQSWTIKIREGLTFSDGSPLTAQSFVDAWNFGANTANAQKSQSFFQPIEGFDEVSADDATEDLTLSGLEVVDDTTFTVKLVSAQADFSSRLGYSAYSPLPDSAYEDIDGFGEKPVGN